ncbi:putative serine/threonine protein phosphatase [Coemansia javaensis]|uniref:Serine/threonine-protein phosphatase n=1 Tax=Coemansia javaensis TaxID=2761396 RepID=A0A9W8H408_9FUNG|nr:putative serine/threonine protein phosphatase [Coemansia javaensis]
MGLDVGRCVERLYRGELLAEWEITQVCAAVQDLLADEANVVGIAAPVTVIGDVHGQFFDLLEIFAIGGRVPDTNYLFLGDYVDRGHHSVETMSLLACLKLQHPRRVHLLRGNHESRSITRTYGFYAECMQKYGSAGVWRDFTDLFDCLALAVTIDDSVFCVHGGLSPSILHIDQMRALDRFGEIPSEGPLADLLWSDPDPDVGTFGRSQRGAGFTFGAAAVDRFLHVNGMSHVLRAHQLCMEGYLVLFNDRLSTVWSAPNYCYRCGNVASLLNVGPYLQRDFITFDAAPRSSEPAKPHQLLQQQQQQQPAPAPDSMYFL